MRKFLLLVTIFFSVSASAQERRLYIKPHLNFQFPLVKTIRQDYLPYAKTNNNHRNAVIIPGVRFEYLKANGNGYFFNFGTLPLGFAVQFQDYAFIDPVYNQRALTNLYTLLASSSSSSDIWAFDIGLINRLITLGLSKRKAIDIKLGYGFTVSSIRPYSEVPGFGFINKNSMNKEWMIVDTTYPLFDPNKGKWGLMLPFKLDFNIKSKARNVELLNFELAYWHGLSRGSKFNVAYYNITDNITYDNVIESKGSTWQMSVQIPIRIKRIGKLKF